VRYAGAADPHDADRTFGPDSAAFRVAAGTLPTPSREPAPSLRRRARENEGVEAGRTDADGKGEQAKHPGEVRGDMSYRAYSVARVNKRLVLTIDWAAATEGNEYLDMLDSVVSGYLVGNIRDLVRCHRRFGGRDGN
jgi:hypothetical protein